MTCKICKLENKAIFKAKILKKYEISYFYCENCGFLQTEEPYWLDESYKSPINISDTGILSRNLYLSRITSILIYGLFNKNGKFLDYAGGYGIFIRLMRDIGFDFYWYDKYAENLFARGFEYNENDKIELITSFESFEHFVNPMAEIEKMLKICTNVMFTTEILPNPIIGSNNWWYYGLEHGQHISFYSLKTLNFIAQKYNLYFYTNDKSLHLFTTKKINPKLFWFLIKVAARLRLDYFIRGKMESKTFEDMEKLKKNV